MTTPALSLYGLKNCDTCRKAISALEDAGYGVTFIDIRTGADLPRLIPVWLEALGPTALVNKRSTTWRGLSPEEQSAAQGDGASDALIANPTLIKRPIIESGTLHTVGWTSKTIAAYPQI